MQHHVGGSEVRVSLGRRADGEEADQMQRTKVHRLLDDVGPRPARRRDALPVEDRRAVPEELPDHRQDDTEAAVPRLRSHLSPALPGSRAARRGSASQHVLQALHLLRAGVPAHRPARVGALAGAHRQADGEGVGHRDPAAFGRRHLAPTLLPRLSCKFVASS